MAIHSTSSNSSSPWLHRLVPAIGSLQTYSIATFRADTIAGLTVAAVAVPQAMAYASIVGIPVEYGLYTAIVMTAVGAVLDSSKQLINGPTNAISIAVVSALSALTFTDPQQRISAAILLALMVGLIQTSISCLRLGDLTRYISHAVIVGFTAGAAVLLMLDQLKNLLGLKAQGSGHDPFLKRFWLTLSQGGPVDYWTLAFGVGTIVFVLGLRAVNIRFRWRIPELLVAVAFSALIVWLGGFERQRDGEGNIVHGRVEVIGNIPRMLPSFSTPELNRDWIRTLAGSALAISLLGLLEAIAMAKAIASRTGQKLDINQQCLSEGLANVAGSFFSCYPGSGSLTRSAINHQSGGQTQWSGVISALAVAATILLFAPAARFIPRAALAGILVVTALRMVDRYKFLFHMRATRFDAIITIATAVAAVAISVEFCILIGTFLSFLFYVPRAAHVDMTELVITPERVIRERKPADPECDRLRLYNLEGELFFGSGPELEHFLDEIADHALPPTAVVVLRLKYARNPDGVCLDLLHQFVERMDARGIVTLFCGVRAPMLRALENAGLVARVGKEHIFPEAAAVWSSTLDAVRYAYERLGNDVCETCTRRTTMAHASRDGDWYYMI